LSSKASRKTIILCGFGFIIGFVEEWNYFTLKELESGIIDEIRRKMLI